MKSSDAWLCAPLAAASLLAGLTATSVAHADLPTNVPPPPPLNWQPCEGVTGRDCSTLTVPLDYADLTKGTLDIPVVRIPAGDPSKRVGTLVYNPGGPGQAAAYQLWDLDNAYLLEHRWFSADLLARFDIVAYNPRGTSEGIVCKDAAMAAVYQETNRFSRSNTELATLLNLEHKINANCHDDNQPLVNHVNSASVVRDMEQLRRAAGWTTFSYLGRSYGTFLGYRYARLYPGKLRALMLDAAIDRSVTDQQASEENAIDSEQLWQDFKVWCQAKTECRLRGMDIESEVTALMARARATPLPATRADDPPYEGLTTRPVNDWQLSFAIQVAAAAGDITFPAVEQLLGDAILHNDGSTARIIWDSATDASAGPNGEVIYPPQDYSVNRAVNCSDTKWSQTWATPTNVLTYINRMKQVAPRMGETNAVQAIICYNWVTAPVEPAPLTVSFPTAVPTLVVGGTKDASTPFVWSQRIATKTGGRLLTRQGYGHTSYDKSRCAQQKTDQFLISLTLPPAGTVCQTDADLYPIQNPILPPL